MDTKENQPSTSIQEELNTLLTQPLVCEGARACLFNLIIYTHEGRRTAYFSEIIKMIRTQFPCRIIFITANPNTKENYFRIRTITEKNPDGSGFLCDQINIDTAGDDIRRVTFLLYPLFVPDLPIYLLWGQDPTTEFTILPHLEYFATRLIVDAEANEDLQQFSRAMLNRMHDSSSQIVDMNWARTNGWREVLAQIFDSPERLDQLVNATHIEFFFNNNSKLFLHLKTQAVYLQAWLSCRLKWQFLKIERNNGSQIIQYTSNNKIRSIQLSPINDPKFETEEVVSIHVQGDYGYECEMKRVTLDQIKVQAFNQSQCELPFVLLMPTLRSGRSFMQQIFYQKMSDQYEEMLQLISQTQWS